MSIINATTTAGVALTGDTSGNLTIQSAGTNVATFTTGGNMVFGTSNAGIVFNNSSATTNSTLNDYESGTFTPSLGNTGGTPSYSLQSGYYTKIGSLVTVQIYIQCTVTGSGGSTVQILGLPFTSATSVNTTGSFFPTLGFGGSWSMICPDIPSSSNYAFLYTSSQTTGQNYNFFTGANLGSSVNLRTTFSYKATF